MDISQVIIGPVMTEKTELLKSTHRTHTLIVAPKSTKVDVRNALEKYYDVEVESVRIIRTRPKTRSMHRRGSEMEKRHRQKKALVTLSKKSKNFDLANFKV